MKKINIVLLLVALLSLVGLAGVVMLAGPGAKTGADTEPTGSALKEYQENYEENKERSKTITVTVLENFSRAETAAEIYDIEGQKKIREKIDTLIAAHKYSEDTPLLIYNPFLTNSQSLYVYFETEWPCVVSYAVNPVEKEYAVFGGNAVETTGENSYVHEFRVTGLVPETKNMVTLSMKDADGRVVMRRFYYDNPHTVEAKRIVLKSEQGMEKVTQEDGTVGEKPASEDSQAEGFFVVFPQENALMPFLRFYGNNGMLRAEIPLEEYGTRKLLLSEGELYFLVSPTKLAGLDSLGQVTELYSDKNYIFGTDYCFDDNGNIMILASDRRQTSVDDCVLLIDRKNGEIKELVDLGDILPDYKKKGKEKNGVLDWISLSSIEWLGSNRILLASKKDDTVIKLRRIYNDPRLAYLAGSAEVWENTPYVDSLLRVEGEWSFPSGLLQAGTLPYDMVRESRHYLYTMSNNEDKKYKKGEIPFSEYHRYLVDEAEGSIREQESFILPQIKEAGSIQWFDGHLIFAADTATEFCEYDGNWKLITKYIYEEPIVIKTEEELEYEEDNPPPDTTLRYLGVGKYDMNGYFFEGKPILYVPVVEEEEAEE